MRKTVANRREIDETHLHVDLVEDVQETAVRTDGMIAVTTEETIEAGMTDETIEGAVIDEMIAVMAETEEVVIKGMTESVTDEETVEVVHPQYRSLLREVVENLRLPLKTYQKI